MKYYFKDLQFEKVDHSINVHNTFRYAKIRHKLLNELIEYYKQ
jgi:L-amino acid N-acyltransferase YncA